MTDQPAETPPEPDTEITASVTVTGSQAALLRDLAAVLGRTPEALAIEWAAGALRIPPASVGETVPPDDWGLFDGPADLSAHAHELLREELGR
ncbi:hypothetical protein ABR737_00465 [Streptomyces sp. Edi2]|uniref:hypothetical protein n=1 Tax=Streptomyces sp. Edi2 TaxID=3162528 RepID=UPI0033069257